jgi:hypothetical protein
MWCSLGRVISHAVSQLVSFQGIRPHVAQPLKWDENHNDWWTGCDIRIIACTSSAEHVVANMEEETQNITQHLASAPHTPWQGYVGMGL